MRHWLFFSQLFPKGKKWFVNKFCPTVVYYFHIIVLNVLNTFSNFNCSKIKHGDSERLLRASEM